MDLETKALLDQFDALTARAEDTLKAIDIHISRFVKVRDGIGAMMAQLASIAAVLRSSPVPLLYGPDLIKTVEGRMGVHQAVTTATEGALRERAVSRFPIETGIPLPNKPEAMWQIIARTMAGVDRFSMTQAGIAVEHELGRSIGKNRPQTIRNNLVRHPETFVQNADGSWSVVGKEKEVIPEETTP